MTVSIVIPNYNGALLLRKNLPAVRKAAEAYKKSSKTIAEVIISDDASTDDSKSVVSSVAPEVLYLEHNKNAGFATNVNRGVRKARGEIVVLLNTDVAPEENFLIPLIKHFADETVFAVGCMDKSIEGNKVILRGRGVGEWEKGFLVHRASDVMKTDTLWASGGSSAFRKSEWERLGGLYEIYSPFYWEDIDLSYRALKAGRQVLFEPGSVVTHAHEEGAIRKQFTKNAITTIAYRNQFLFVWINITDARMLLSHVLWLPVHIVQAGLRGDSAFFSGFFTALLRLPHALSLRRKNMMHFRTADTRVLASSI